MLLPATSVAHLLELDECSCENSLYANATVVIAVAAFLYCYGCVSGFRYLGPFC